MCTALSCDRHCELTLEAHAASSRNSVPPRHDCGTKGCPAPCKLSKLCSRRCGSDDHFHELSTVEVHLCGQEHQCPELCDGPGVCPMDTSSGDSDWADLHRRQCAVMISSDQWEHKGRHKHSTATPLKHLCGHQCKLCKRPCVVSHGHMDADCKHGAIVQEAQDSLVIKNRHGDCKHLCNQTHVCREMCNNQSGHALCTLGPAPPEAQGDPRASKWSGLERGKRQCCKIIPAGQQQHSRQSEHICSSAPSDHFCGVPCPFCDQPCHLKVNHDGLHDTLHTASKYKYDQEQKGLVPIGPGKGLTCSQLCSEAGRGHVHVHQEEYSAVSEEVCQDSQNGHDLASSGRRHTSQRDILTHARFWFVQGFKDPHLPEDLPTFKMCPAVCPDDANFCKGELWHPSVLPVVGDGSQILVAKEHSEHEGHRFSCSHHCDEKCPHSEGDGDKSHSSQHTCALPAGHHPHRTHECVYHRQECGEPCSGGGSLQLCQDQCRLPRTKKHSVHTCGDESKECPFPCHLAHECGRRCGSKDHLHNCHVRENADTMAHVCGVEHHADSFEAKTVRLELRSAARCLAKCPMCNAVSDKGAGHDGRHTALHSHAHPAEDLQDGMGMKIRARPEETCVDICR